MVEKRNVVAEDGCTSRCDSNRLSGVGFLDGSLVPTLESFPTEYMYTLYGAICFESFFKIFQLVTKHSKCFCNRIMSVS